MLDLSVTPCKVMVAMMRIFCLNSDSIRPVTAVNMKLVRNVLIRLKTWLCFKWNMIRNNDCLYDINCWVVTLYPLPPENTYHSPRNSKFGETFMRRLGYHFRVAQIRYWEFCRKLLFNTIMYFATFIENICTFSWIIMTIALWVIFHLSARVSVKK